MKINQSNYPIPLSRPDISEIEINSVLEVLKTPYLSLGPKVIEFEQRFADYIGVRYAVAVCNGTAGLHLAVKSLNIGANDAVITTPFSFISSANCILFENATPVFVDIDEASFNIDPDKIEKYLRQDCSWDKKKRTLIDRNTGKVVKAILPVHVFGLPCQMDRIMNFADEFGLYVIEDCCEAIGAKFDNKMVSTFGNVGVFAFYPNKQITTGEGGLIATDDEEIVRLCRSLRNQGRDANGGWLAHQRLGYNYRISDINCALGIAQLDRITEILRKRANVAGKYIKKVQDLVHIPESEARAKRSWFVFVVRLPDHFAQSDRDEILAELTRRKIGCNNYFPPIHLQPFYRQTFGFQVGDFPVTEKVSKRTLALPFYNNLRDEEIDYIAGSLTEVLERYHLILEDEAMRPLVRSRQAA